MIERVDHYSFPAGDPEAMIAFYRALGFGVLDSYNGRLVAFQFGKQKLNVHLPNLWRNHAFTARGVTAAPGCGDIRFFWPGSIESIRSTLRAIGAPIVTEPGGGGAPAGTLYTRDPDGNLLEFMGAPGQAAAPAVSEGGNIDATIGHFVVPVADASAMLSFYEKLGFSLAGEPSWRGGAQVTTAIAGQAKIYFVELFRDGAYAPPSLLGRSSRPGSADYCLVWDGTPDSAAALIGAAGGDVILGPSPMEGGDGGGRRAGVSVYTRDPDGNLVEFISY